MTTFSYSTGSPTEQAVDLLVLPVFEGPEPGPGIKDVRGVDLMALCDDARLKGRVGETLLIPNAGIADVAAKAILVVGVGPKGEADVNAVRRAAGRAAKRFGDRRAIATTLAQVGRAAADSVEAVVEGTLLGSYRFDRYKSQGNGAKSAKGKAKTQKEVAVTLYGPGRLERRAANASIKRAQVVCESQMWARDLVNTPALDLPPAAIARAAQAMAREVGLTCKVWNETQLKTGGFGGILGVGSGSANPPRMIELRYSGGSGKPIALSGKGIAFDSGGLSIKTASGMETMKDDMGGAASIMATMRALAILKPKINVIAAIPCAENMPSGTAIRPGDILTHRGGKTSEVLNTDAEGRLVLADALAYLAEQDPELIIDTATLTGAMVVALGDEVWGVFGNDRRLTRDLVEAGEAAGEPGWELPLWKGYRPYIDSHIADIRNTGKKPGVGGSITAAWFLAEFVGDVPWAHIDIAGVAFGDETDLSPKGATGAPVRTLVRYITGLAGPRRK